MNSTLRYVSAPVRPAGRVLAIEPDAARADALRASLRLHVHVDLEIVTSTEEAIRSISGKMPDLVLTSTFLPPADEGVLKAYVQQIPEAAHVQIINLPYFIDSDDASTSDRSSTRTLAFLRRRPAASIRPRCDVRTLSEQIEEYLGQALAGRLSASATVETALVEVPRQTEIWTSDSKAAIRADAACRVPTSILGQRDDRRRARRRRSGDLPSLWTIRVPWASNVCVIDISNSGVALETRSKIAPGSTVDLQLVGRDLELNVPARMVRTEIAGVDASGVKYRVAGAFARDLDLEGLQPTVTPALSAKCLVDLFAHVVGDVNRPGAFVGARERFEHELRRLLPVRDVQIRRTPVVGERGTESIYFTVSTGSGQPQILQAVFEPGYEPSAMEFRFMRAAANIAAAVLEFAPVSGESDTATLLSA
jgi:hypothetical protein